MVSKNELKPAFHQIPTAWPVQTNSDNRIESDVPKKVKGKAKLSLRQKKRRDEGKVKFVQKWCEYTQEISRS